MRRRRQVRLEQSRPIAAKAPFNSLASRVPALAIRIQQNCHRGSVRNGILEELHSFLRTRGPESAVPKFGR